MKYISFLRRGTSEGGKKTILLKFMQDTKAIHLRGIVNGK